MINRLVLVVILIPIAIVLIALAVSNRGMVPFTIDPFNPGNPALTIHLPLFVFLFAAGGAGVILGSCVTWMKQGRYRKVARLRSVEAETLKAEAKKSAQPPASALALPKRAA